MCLKKLKKLLIYSKEWEERRQLIRKTCSVPRPREYKGGGESSWIKLMDVWVPLVSARFCATTGVREVDGGRGKRRRWGGGGGGGELFDVFCPENRQIRNVARASPPHGGEFSKGGRCWKGLLCCCCCQPPLFLTCRLVSAIVVTSP